MNAKVRYFLSALKKRCAGADLACPSCGHADSTVVDRKALVTSLQRCRQCRLLFRQPTTTPQENEVFYNTAYTQGFTTDMPIDAQLQQLMASGFAGSEKDYSVYLQVLAALGARPGQRVLDFGCSWGYGSWQIRRAGFDVVAVEVSQPRGAFARDKLGVDVHPALDSVTGQFDVFFSAHVLEHVPSPKLVFGQAFDRLKVGGLFVAFTPNGSAVYRQAQPGSWHRLWGLVHPNFLDEEFYDHAFASAPRLFAALPYDASALAAAPLDRPARTVLPLAGYELLFASRKLDGQTRWG